VWGYRAEVAWHRPDRALTQGRLGRGPWSAGSPASSQTWSKKAGGPAGASTRQASPPSSSLRPPLRRAIRSCNSPASLSCISRSIRLAPALVQLIPRLFSLSAISLSTLLSVAPSPLRPGQCRVGCLPSQNPLRRPAAFFGTPSERDQASAWQARQERLVRALFSGLVRVGGWCIPRHPDFAQDSSDLSQASESRCDLSPCEGCGTPWLSDNCAETN